MMTKSVSMTNPLVDALLTDAYQLTTVYGWWVNKMEARLATYDLFYRVSPFDGQYAIFGGLSEVLKFVKNFGFTEEQIDYIRRALMPDADPAFFEWLANVDTSEVQLFAQEECTLISPRVPMIRVSGPMGVCQLLETVFENLTGFPSLVATNAARFRVAAGPGKGLLEFGPRRAQGPDGAVSASRYAVLGGFDSTSNLKAGSLFDIPVVGTHPHAWVMSFSGLEDIVCPWLKHEVTDKKINFVELVLEIRKTLGYEHTNESELASFIAFGRAFPKAFRALVDTYDTLNSGVPNYMCVAIALKSIGYEPIGIRLDSGDLAYLSKEARKMFRAASEKIGHDITGSKIVASNDISEKVLYQLNREGHEIDVFGIGTKLVTCEGSPSFGVVYKIVQTSTKTPIKLSNEPEKTTIPGCKNAYRLYDKEGRPFVDLMTLDNEAAPEVGQRIICRHPFKEIKRFAITPSKVVNLLPQVWDGKNVLTNALVLTPEKLRERAINSVTSLREDQLRPVNPAPYKVSVSDSLYARIHELMQNEAPVQEID